MPDSLGTDDHATDPDCSEKWELCADAEAAGKLVRFVSDAKRFIREAQIRCGEEPSK